MRFFQIIFRILQNVRDFDKFCCFAVEDKRNLRLSNRNSELKDTKLCRLHKTSLDILNPLCPREFYERKQRIEGNFSDFCILTCFSDFFYSCNGSPSSSLLILISQLSMAVVYRGFCVGGTPLGGGYFFHWRKQKFRVFSNSKIFKKCLKNQ